MDIENVTSHLSQNHGVEVSRNQTLEGHLVSCPHCHKSYNILDPREGLVYQCQQCQTQFFVQKESPRHFQAFKWSEEQIFRVLYEIPGEPTQSQLTRAWRSIFDDLQDENLHRQFILLCRQKNSLEIAREKYRQLSLYLHWNQLPPDLQNILEPSRQKNSLWKEKVPWVLLGISLIFILLGSVLPGYRNMIGAGVLLIILDSWIYRHQIKLLF